MTSRPFAEKLGFYTANSEIGFQIDFEGEIRPSSSLAYWLSMTFTVWYSEHELKMWTSRPLLQKVRAPYQTLKSL